MPVYKLDEMKGELVTPTHSQCAAHSLHAVEDTEVVSAKGIVGGVGHRI